MPHKLTTPEKTKSDKTIDDISWMLFTEARGEGEEGMRDVASVLAKRSKRHGDFSKEVYKRKQFSGVGEGPPEGFRFMDMEPGDKEAQLKSQEIAIEMVEGKFQPTIDASHYYNNSIVEPSWGKKLIGAEQRGSHRFGNLAGEYGTPRLRASAEGQ